MEKEKVREQAKKIMDDFIAVLGNKQESDFSIIRKKSLREDNKCETDKEFRKNWLKILKKKKDGYLVAEKGHWK